MQELRKRGHEIEVLTGFPNYPEGKIYPGYRLSIIKRELMGDIRITRVPLYPNHDSNGFKRLLNYISFAVSALLIGPLVVGRFDVAYIYHPPATVFLPALGFRILRRKPCIYDIQDLWPDTLESTGMIRNRRVLSAVGIWCRIAYHFADRILVLSPGFRKKLILRGVPSHKISVIYNWADDSVIRQVGYDQYLAEELELQGRFVVMFAGNMGMAQALSAVIDAAVIVAGKNPMVKFVFVGDGVEEAKLKERTKDLNLENVSFVSRRPIAEISYVMSLADVLLVHLRNDLLFDITIPSKIQTYMAIGRPILAAVRGDAADLVRKTGSGEICEPENPCNIAEAVLKMASMDKDGLLAMGQKGKEYYEKHLSLRSGAGKIDEALHELTGKL